MMSRWEECLRVLASINATDLVIEPNSRPRFKVGPEWQLPEEEVWNSESCDQLCLSLLTEPEKHQLADQRYIKVIFESGKASRFRVHIMVQESGFAFHVRRHFPQVPKIQDAYITRVAVDLFQAQRGLVVVSAGHGQGKTTTAASILQHELMRSYRSLVLYEECAEMNFELPISRIQVSAELSAGGLTRYSNANHFAQVHCYDLGFEKSAVEAAMYQALAGQLAVLVLPFDGVIRSVHALHSGLKQWGLNCYAEQLGQVMHAAIGQTLVPAREFDVLPCFEVCAATPNIKAKISNEEFDSMDSLMSQSGDNSGMRSLNQSLLQLVLRRKIEMKQAFQSSRNPEELDSMLNKAGI